MSAAKKYLYDLSLPEKKTIKKDDKFKLIKKGDHYEKVNDYC